MWGLGNIRKLMGGVVGGEVEEGLFFVGEFVADCLVDALVDGTGHFATGRSEKRKRVIVPKYFYI